MKLKGNRGEWSELYAFFKLLAEGRLYSGDGKLNRYSERYVPILKVFRDDSPDRTSYTVGETHIHLLQAGKTETIDITRERFAKEARRLLDCIQTMKGSCQLEWLEPFMSEIGCDSLKSKSSDKADIRIVIHDLKTGMAPELGYSIKSKLGSPSTLINANKGASAFVYRIDGMTRQSADAFNSNGSFKAKFKMLEDAGASVSFFKVAGDALHFNLTMLDTAIDRIMAEELLAYYKGKANTIEKATALVGEQDPLALDCEPKQRIYAYKVKQFLLAFALGMTVSKPWEGKFNATGGYIVVKEDGDIVCYHFFDRSELEDYLYFNTRFETPSTTRHDYGKIYEENGAFFVKLNLQVRFV